MSQTEVALTPQQQYIKSWQGFGNKRTTSSASNYPNKQPATPAPISFRRNNEDYNNTLIQEIRADATHKELVELLDVILQNQRAFAPELNRNNNQELLKLVLENQKTFGTDLNQINNQILENQQNINEGLRHLPSIAEQCEQNTELLKTVQLLVSDLKKELVKNSKARSMERDELQRFIEKQLKAQHAKCNENAEAVQAGQKKLKEFLERSFRDYQQSIQKTIKDQLKLRDKKTYTDLRELLEEQLLKFSKSLQEKLGKQLSTHTSKLEDTISRFHKEEESKGQQRFLWVEKALNELKALQQSKTRSDSVQPQFNQGFLMPNPQPMRRPLASIQQKPNDFWNLGKNYGQNVCNYELTPFKEPHRQPPKPTDQRVPVRVSKLHPSSRTTTKRQKRRKSVKQVPQKVYPLRSSSCFTEKRFSPPVAMKRAYDSDAESSSVSCNYSELEKTTFYMQRKTYYQPQNKVRRFTSDDQVSEG